MGILLLIGNIMTTQGHHPRITSLAYTPKINNMFGTDGIRGAIGSSPFILEDLLQLGHAIGQWVVHKYGPHATLLIAHDTRLSCSWVKSAIKSTLLMHPLNIIDAGVLPTPAVVQLTLKQDSIQCGIIISASHNPFHDNGIKIIDGLQGKLQLEDEQHITHLFYTYDESACYAALGEEHYWDKAQSAYINYVQQFFKPHFLNGKKIVIDCAHGATYQIAPSIFQQFDADVICIGHTPNGMNINEKCGATHVEQLQQTVIKEKADIGFAFDGDGDRVIAVNCHGEIKDGDDILALLLDHPHYRNTTKLVGTVMTNVGFEHWLKEKGIALARTPVGDKYIARCLEEEKLIIGGEESGHIVLYNYLPSGDGIFTALRVMETIIDTHNEQMHTFKHTPQILINIPIKEKKDLTQGPLSSIIKEYENQLPYGRILVRYSGTQPILRVMVEDTDEIQAQTIGNGLAHTLQKALGGTC